LIAFYQPKRKSVSKQRSERASSSLGAMFVLPVDAEIELVLAEERHAEEVAALIVRNQRRLARWEPWAEHPATVAALRSYIRGCLDGFATGTQVQTYIRVGGRLVGSCGLRVNPRTRTGEIGYWLDADHEGRGIASRAARALVAGGFRERGLVRMELRTAVDNVRSRALAERLGFVHEATQRGAQVFATRRADMVLYALPAPPLTRWGVPAPP
jgi:ribosomal-protein-serine acetyltransferase